MSDDALLLECNECDRRFAIENGIPLLFWPNEWDSKTDATGIVNSFYEESPFPNYEEVDSEFSFREKAEKGVFPRLLNQQIPHGARVLEVGCGTGQLANYLGMKWGRTVFGADMCLNSLKLGQEFRQRNEIANTALVQMNLFRPAFKSENFDLVLCNGVLHHTSDPFMGFQSISRLVKRGGFIIIGLYNTFGRLPTDIRRIVFKLSGNRFRAIDSRLRDKSVGDTRKYTWFQDQYKHPHESKHTIGEVTKWFEQTGFEFVNGIPKVTPFNSFDPDEPLFASNAKGSWLDHLIVQAGMLLGGGKEGGFFVIIGRKG